MEINRKIYSKLCDWKKASNGSKALLIEGARRIGKSTVSEEFGKKEYRSYILIDFNKATKKVRDLFENLNELDVFYQSLSLEYIEAAEQVRMITKQLVDSRGINEELKAVDMLRWVAEMDAAKHDAEEIVLRESIYN